MHAMIAGSADWCGGAGAMDGGPARAYALTEGQRSARGRLCGESTLENDQRPQAIAQGLREHNRLEDGNISQVLCWMNSIH
jgi:hypothetical protein